MQNIDIPTTTQIRPSQQVIDEWNRYRKLFPHTRHRVFLNHASLSPMHRNAMRAIERHMLARSSDDIEYWPTLLEEKQEFKTLLGKFIHAAPDNIAVTSSTSMGLNWLAQGLSWKAGDRILLNRAEFPSNIYPFLNLENLGVHIDTVPTREGRVDIEDIVSRIHPRTRLLSISYVEFLNGFRNDLQEIGRICREHDIIFCVDGIQGIGALEIDVDGWGIDFLSSGGQKWLMWPLGTAFFYTSPRIFDRVRPMAAGWLSVQNSWDFFNYDLNYLQTAERFEPGMFNAAGICGAIASLELFLDIGAARIEQRILQTTDYLIERLTDNGYKIVSIIEPKYRSGIVTFDHDRSEDLWNFLKMRDVNVSLRNGLIRVAPHFYNTTDEIDHLIEMIIQFDRR